jgi:hypothetical protein
LLAGLAKKPYIFFKMHWAWIGASRRDDHPESRTDAAEHVVGRFFEQIRSGSEITPPTSFYEQVRGRIEQIERQSVWVPFIYSGVPLRLAMSFLALSLIALGYMFIAESNIKSPDLRWMVKRQERSSIPVMSNSSAMPFCCKLSPISDGTRFARNQSGKCYDR